MRLKTGLKSGPPLVALVLFLSTLITTPAHALLSHDGRVAGTSSADGSYARITGHGFSPRNSQCVIYSVSTVNRDAERLIQAGLLRCNNQGLGGGTCTGGTSFVERGVDANTYYCVPGYTITNNTQYDATTHRTSSTGTQFRGHANGATAYQSGFNLSHETRAYAWAEPTGNTGYCQFKSRASFNNWKRYDTSLGWKPITASSKHHFNKGMYDPPCYPTITAISSGNFEVNDDPA